MARVLLKPGITWEFAHEELKKQGVVLTHKKHRKGGYVCYTSVQTKIKNIFKENE